MAAWSDGYFTDIQYTSHMYPELAPGYMAFACLRQGVRPPALGPGSTYLELGCGQGYGLNLLAAANPATGFWGVDFHPGQIDNAQRLARAAGLSNIAFEDLSFEQLLALPEGRLPKFDVIALHGIYSWVSPENRAAIVRILDRMLKPGGMAYVSYNCLPAWGPLVPLRRFVVEHVARTTGDPEVRIVEALRAALQMLEGGANGFASVPTMRGRIEAALHESPAYLVHEYLNEHSQPFFHADVAKALEGARLSFAASANIADDIVHLAARAPLQAAIAATQDPTWKQTLLDYAGDKPFRRDIFVRGRNALGDLERRALLNDTRFVLLASNGAEAFDFPIPIGRVQGQANIYQPIVDALVSGPASYGELAALPALAGAREGAALQALILLVGARRIHPLAAGTPAAATGFTRAILDRLPLGEVPHHLAAPRAGTAVGVEFSDLLALNALAHGDDAAQATRRGWEVMAATGRRLLRDGAILPDQAANEAELAARIAAFNQVKLPLYRELGVI
jgi:SAM-dependent methyltransferase